MVRMMLALGGLSLATMACGEKDVVDSGCVCYDLYAPVCGSDGVTYSNDCQAECAGVEFTQGECASGSDDTAADDTGA